MKDLFQIISIGLYFLVGIISLIMAYKTLFSKKLVEYQDKASGRSWERIEKPLQYVIIALMRVSGFGFLSVAILFLVFPAVNFFIHDLFIKYAVPAVGVIFCTGLLISNYSLSKRTQSQTPWKGAMMAVFIIITGFILSLF